MKDPARQLSLISDDEVARIVEDRATRDFKSDDCIEGQYTLERFEANEPRLLQAVISLRGAGMGIKDVAKLLNVGHKTIMAVDGKYADHIATRKARVGRRWMEVAELAAEAARDRLVSGCMAKEGLRDIVVAGATAMDKAMLAAGEATEIRRVEFEAPGLAAFDQELRSMGLGSGTRDQKGTVEADYEMVDPPALEDSPVALDVPDTDKQSVGESVETAANKGDSVGGVNPVQSKGDSGQDRVPGAGGGAGGDGAGRERD